MPHSRFWVTIFFSLLLFFYCFGFFLLSYQLPDLSEDLDFIVSAPPSLQPGYSQNILFYAFKHGRTDPAHGLALEAFLRLPHTSRLMSLGHLDERRPGQYLLRTSLKDGLMEGKADILLAPRQKPHLALFSATFPLHKTVNLAVVPPGDRAFAGSTITFKAAVLDSVKGLPMSGVPVRCRVFSPDNLPVVNRLVKTHHNGMADFSCHLNRLTPPGTYTFRFATGGQSVAFSLPVFPQPPLGKRLEEMAASLVFAVIPLLDKLYAPGDPATGAGASSTWATSDLLWKTDGALRARLRDKHIELDFVSALTDPDFAALEIWFKDTVIYHRQLDLRKFPLKIKTQEIFPFPKPISFPKAYPIRVVIWESRRNTIQSHEVLFPPMRAGIARKTFWNMSRLIPQKALSLEKKLHFSGKGKISAGALIIPNLGFLKSLKDISHGVFVLLAFLFVFLHLFPQFTAVLFPDAGGNPPLKRRYFTFRFLILLTAMYACVYGFSYPANIVFPAGLLGTCLVVLYLVIRRPQLFPDHTQELRRLNNLALLFCCIWLAGHLCNLFFPRTESTWFISLSMSFGILGLVFSQAFLHGITVSAIPGWLFRFVLSTSENVSSLFAIRTWKGAVLQVGLLLSCLFLFFFLGNHVLTNIPSGTVLDIEDSINPSLESPQEEEPEFRFHSVFQLSPDDPIRSHRNPYDIGTQTPRLFFQMVRSPRARYSLVRKTMILEQKKADNITLFIGYRSFLDRVVQRLQISRPTFSHLYQEAIARIERFPLLSSSEQKDELLLLESFMAPLTHIMMRTGEGLANSPFDARLPLRFFFQKATKCLFIDPGFLRTQRIGEALSEDPVNLRDWMNVQAIDEDTPPANEQFFFTRRQLADMFSGGGSVVLSGHGRKAICTFLLTNETLFLTKGINFPQDLELTLLEIRRNAPLVVEVAQ